MPNVLLALSGVAASAPAEEPLDTLVDRLVPEIEAIAGRPFGELPVVRMVDRREYRKILLDEAGGGTFDETHRKASEDIRSSVWFVLGQYSRKNDEILLIEEQRREMREEFGRAEGDAMFRCLLVHELVHALDARHVPEFDGDDLDSDGWRTLRLLGEGHATWVSRRWCEANEGAEIAARASLFEQVVSSSQPSDSFVSYGWGSRFVEALDARDPDLYWAYRAEPPPFRLVQMAMSPVFLPGWTDGSPLIRAFDGVDLPRPDQVWTLPLTDHLDELDLAPQIYPVAHAGLQTYSGFRNRYVQVDAFALGRINDAPTIVNARLAQVTAFPEDEFSVDGRTAPIRRVVSRSSSRLDDAGFAGVRITAKTSFRPYLEVWAYDERRLVVISAYGVKGLRVSELEDVAARLLAELPPDAEPGPVWWPALELAP